MERTQKQMMEDSFLKMTLLPMESVIDELSPEVQESIRRERLLRLSRQTMQTQHGHYSPHHSEPGDASQLEQELFDEQLAKVPADKFAAAVEKLMKEHSPGVTNGPLPAKDITKK